MPTVVFEGQRYECERGEVLKDVLTRHGATPHSGPFRVVNCRSHGSCGSCAVEVRGKVTRASFFEKLRVRLPPLLDRGGRLRLACKTLVQGDVEVVKHGGWWGQRLDR